MIFRSLLQIGVSGQRSLRCECLNTDDDHADKDLKDKLFMFRLVAGIAVVGKGVKIFKKVVMRQRKERLVVVWGSG